MKGKRYTEEFKKEAVKQVSGRGRREIRYNVSQFV
ncbi:MAG: transposase-like protein [Pseudohongiellaceae bacterium]|jgi:transposase-like protein